MTAHTLGERLRRARLALAAREGRTISQTEMAQRVGVTQAAYGKWEAGAREPDLAMLVKLARVLEVNVGVLAFGTLAHEAWPDATLAPVPDPRSPNPAPADAEPPAAPRLPKPPA